MNIKGYKILEYSILLFGGLTFLVMFYVYKGDRMMLIRFSAIAALLYSLWGMLHHKIENRLTLEIALEYILISIFVFMLVFTALCV